MKVTRQPTLPPLREKLKQRNLSCQHSSPRHRPCPAPSEASFSPSPQDCDTAAAENMLDHSLGFTEETQYNYHWHTTC